MPESFYSKPRVDHLGNTSGQLFLWIFNEKITDDIFRVLKCLTFAESVGFRHFKTVVRFQEDS